MLRLAWLYLRKNRLTSILIISSFTIFIFFPLLTNYLSGVLEKKMVLRAEQTPFIVTKKGSRFVNLLSAVYFNSEKVDELKWSDYQIILDRGVKAIPIYNRFTSKTDNSGNYISFPLVGVDEKYFKFRRLTFQKGGRIIFPGEAVLGSLVSDRSGLKVGDIVMSEPPSLYNINAYYPLKLKIVGILKKSFSPDDEVIFTGMKSTWIMGGYFHGHKAVDKLSKINILSNSTSNVMTKMSVIEYDSITPKNVDDFHFHGDKKDLPLSAIIVLPKSKRESVILSGVINSSDRLQMIKSETVVRELLSIVFAVQKIFNGYFIFILIAAVSFISIMIVLTLKMRQEEIKMISMIGGSRFVILRMLLTEYFILFTTSLFLSLFLTWGVFQIIKSYLLMI